MCKLLTRSLALVFVFALTAFMASDSITTVTAGNLVADPNPLLAEWEGPVRRRPTVRPRADPALQTGARSRDGREARGDPEASRNDPAPPDFRKHDCRAGTLPASTLDRVSTLYGVWGSTMASPELPGGAARDGAASSPPSAIRSRRTKRSSNASKLFTTHPTKAKLNAGTAASGLALLHKLCSRRRAS